jgi:tRNA dimethylallyltransferase
MEIRSKNNKLIVILGPTSSGKTGLSIKLAKKFNGQVVSADSRQVYKGLDIGSGKVTKKEMAGIRHYLLDVANPKNRFSVTQYQKLAKKAITEINKNNKIPFLVGGTGFYLQSIVDNILIPNIKPNLKLRKELEKKSTEELFIMLQKLDPVRAQNIDSHNPRRLVRAVEIVLSTGKPVPKVSFEGCPTCPEFSILQIGITKLPKELKKLIHKRLIARLKNNAMINEVKKIHKQGLSFNRLKELGLEYRCVAQYLQNKITYQEMQNRIEIESLQFTKRQMTWFKRDKRIIWVSTYTEAKKLVKHFLKT